MTTTRQLIAGFRSESASVNGVSLHYWIGGDPNGTPVLLWHGFLGTAYSWHKLMPLLADAGYSILVPDMRGYGDSDTVPSGGREIAARKAQGWAVLEDKSIK